jgi:hypothetical protein
MAEAEESRRDLVVVGEEAMMMDEAATDEGGLLRPDMVTTRSAEEERWLLVRARRWRCECLLLEVASVKHVSVGGYQARMVVGGRERERGGAGRAVTQRPVPEGTMQTKEEMDKIAGRG